jgi:aspartate-semialdehyde dehydrogenase
MKKLRVAVVGATGIAGQQALVALDGHPWFTVTTLAASARSAGKPYAKAIRSEAAPGCGGTSTSPRPTC